MLLLLALLLLQLRAAYSLQGRTASSEQAGDRLRIADLPDFGLSLFINVVAMDVQLGQRPVGTVVIGCPKLQMSKLKIYMYNIEN